MKVLGPQLKRRDSNVLCGKELLLAAGWNRVASGAAGAIELDQRTLVDADRPGILPNVADVVNAARQDLEIAILDGLQSGDFEFGVLRDLF